MASGHRIGLCLVAAALVGVSLSFAGAVGEASRWSVDGESAAAFAAGGTVVTGAQERDCEEGEVLLEIMVVTDRFGSETTWEVRDRESGELVDSGGPCYSEWAYIHRVCTTPDRCFDFTINDSWGDGIIAPGGYRIVYGSTLVADTLMGEFVGATASVEYIGDGCDTPTGACCADHMCLDTRSLNECNLVYGVWLEGVECTEGLCPPAPGCPDGAVVTQLPVDEDGLWYLGASEVGTVWRRYENFVLPAGTGPITSLRWWGVQARMVEGRRWYNCSEPDPTFRVTFYTDEGGLPGDAYRWYTVLAEATATGDIYPPFDLQEYTATLPAPCALSAGWVSIEGMGDPDCWFLWGNSTDGDHMSSVGHAGALGPHSRDLCLCVSSDYEPLFGACCDDASGVCTDGTALLDCCGPGQRFVADSYCVDMVPGCGDVPGACCVAGGRCEQLSEAECLVRRPGDLNCSGAVNYADMDLFVEALSCVGGVGWPHVCPWMNADCNGDGQVTYRDIDSFVALIGTAPLPGAWLGGLTDCAMCPGDLPCPAGAAQEGEPCGVELNGGCNGDPNAPPECSSLSCGGVVCGRAGGDVSAGRADSDWYEIVIDQETQLTLSLTSDGSPLVFGFMEQIAPGVAGCENLTGTLDPVECLTDLAAAEVSLCVEPGTYYAVVTSAFDELLPCPRPYVAALTCESCVVPRGACCFEDGSCAPDASELACRGGAGVWTEGAECTMCPAPEAGDNCSFPITVYLSAESLYSGVGSTCGRFDWYGDTCLGYFDEGEDLVYELVVADGDPLDVNIALDAQGTSFAALLLTDGCPPGMDYVAYNMAWDDMPISLECVRLMPGVYYLIVDSMASRGCIPELSLDITLCEPPVGRCCYEDSGVQCIAGICAADCEMLYGGRWDEGLNCSVPCPVEAGESCATATVVAALPYRVTFDNQTASADGPVGSCDKFAPAGQMQNDVWFVWSSDADGALTVMVTPIGYDPIVAVYTGCEASEWLDCVDEGGEGEQESLVVSVTAGTSYYLQIGDTGAVPKGGLTQLKLGWMEMGACCVDPVPTCNMKSEEDCVAAGGEFLGPGVTCLPDNPCDYCTAEGGCGEYISRVQICGLDMSSGCEQYADFSDVVVSLIPDHAFPMSVTVTDGYLGDSCTVWVDWNQDRIFEDYERKTLFSADPTAVPFTGTLLQPVFATWGQTRMRIRLTFYETPVPCGPSYYGEVEDYTVLVYPW